MHESHHQQGIKDEILHPAVANRHGIHGDDGESGQSRDGLMVHCRLKVDMQCACMPSQTNVQILSLRLSCHKKFSYSGPNFLELFKNRKSS